MGLTATNAPTRTAPIKPHLDPPHRACVDSCGRGAVLVVSELWTEILVVPTRCKTWQCKKCGPILRAQWSERIAHAKPERFLTLTCDTKRFADPAGAFRAMKEALPRLVKALRRSGIPVEYCAVWEITDAGWPHLHIAQKGGFMPQRLIAHYWKQLGIGEIVDVRQVHNQEGVARYVAKYMMKTATNAGLVGFRQRIVTYSRKFFPPPPEDRSLITDAAPEALWTSRYPWEVLEVLVGPKWGYMIMTDPTDTAVHLLRTYPLSEERRMELASWFENRP